MVQQLGKLWVYNKFLFLLLLLLLFLADLIVNGNTDLIDLRNFQSSFEY